MSGPNTEAPGGVPSLPGRLPLIFVTALVDSRAEEIAELRETVRVLTESQLITVEHLLTKIQGYVIEEIQERRQSGDSS